MKIWIKYLIGTLLGIIASIILPMSSPAVTTFVSDAAEFAIRFGRYTLLPLLFFGTSMAFFSIRNNRHFPKTLLWTFGTIIGSTLILAFLGIISILVVKLPRIPITSEKIAEIPSLTLKELLLPLLPHSGFSAITEGKYLLPAFLFAGIAGAGCASDASASKPVLTLFESLAKLCYTVTTFFIEWLSVGMIAISCWWMFQIRNIFASDSANFLPLFLLLLVDFALTAGIIYPLILRFLCRDLRPFNILYASICPILASFFSGDTNLVLQINMKHGKDSLGIHEEINNFSYPLFSIFGKGGAALVTSICFVTILRSYSSLGFTIADVIWIFCTTFGISFLLGALPVEGPFVALTVICTMYGRGFGDGYILLKPALPLICSFSAAFDVLSAMTGSFITAVKTKNITHNDVKHYV